MAEIINMQRKQKKNKGSAEEIYMLASEYGRTSEMLSEIAGAVEEYLPGTAASIGLSASDFVLDQESLVEMEEGLDLGEFSPLVYKAEKGDEKYSVLIGSPDAGYQEDGCMIQIVATKSSGDQGWIYNFDDKKWEEADLPEIDPRMEKIMESGSPESEILEEILCAYEGELAYGKYQSIRSKNRGLFKLYNMVHQYMVPYFDEGELFLEPRDVQRHGFRVGWKGKEYILYQYLDPIDMEICGDISEDEGMFAECFCREVARTDDVKKIKNCLWMLANRFTEGDIYTVPLSLTAYAEARKVKKLRARTYFVRGNRRDLTSQEDRALKSIDSYLRRL